jgi:hypothetical protein
MVIILIALLLAVPVVVVAALSQRRGPILATAVVMAIIGSVTGASAYTAVDLAAVAVATWLCLDSIPAVDTPKRPLLNVPALKAWAIGQVKGLLVFLLKCALVFAAVVLAIVVGIRVASHYAEKKEAAAAAARRNDVAQSRVVPQQMPNPQLPATPLIEAALPEPAQPGLFAQGESEVAGTYRGEAAHGGELEVLIGDKGSEGRHRASITVFSGRCNGAVTGTIAITSGVVAFTSEQDENMCRATGSRDGVDRLVISEGAGCNYFHGAQCDFSGVVTRVSNKAEFADAPTARPADVSASSPSPNP